MTTSSWVSAAIVVLALATIAFLVAAVRDRFWEQPPMSAGRLRFMLPVIACSATAAALGAVQALALDP